MTTTRSPHDSGNAYFVWPYGYFNPSVDTLAIQGIDIGGNFHCHLYFDDKELSFQYNYDHLKCGYYSDGWALANFDDSSWGQPYVTEHQQGFWASTGSSIYCRYHELPTPSPTSTPTSTPTSRPTSSPARVQSVSPTIKPTRKTSKPTRRPRKRYVYRTHSPSKASKKTSIK